jgi:hypothetical protein
MALVRMSAAHLHSLANLSPEKSEMQRDPVNAVVVVDDRALVGDYDVVLVFVVVTIVVSVSELVAVMGLLLYSLVILLIFTEAQYSVVFYMS